MEGWYCFVGGWRGAYCRGSQPDSTIWITKHGILSWTLGESRGHSVETHKRLNRDDFPCVWIVRSCKLTDKCSLSIVSVNSLFWKLAALAFRMQLELVFHIFENWDLEHSSWRCHRYIQMTFHRLITLACLGIWFWTSEWEITSPRLSNYSHRTPYELSLDMLVKTVAIWTEISGRERTVMSPERMDQDVAKSGQRSLWNWGTWTQGKVFWH